MIGTLHWEQISDKIFTKIESSYPPPPHRLVDVRDAHSVDYVDGRILLCGGLNVRRGTYRTCMEMSTGGKSWNMKMNMEMNMEEHGKR